MKVSNKILDILFQHIVERMGPAGCLWICCRNICPVVAELSRELDLNGGNTTWSEEMKRRVSRTARFNFPFSEYVIAATFYPILAGLIALILVALTAGGVWLAVLRIIQFVRR